MRHLKATKILGRTSSHRKALFNNLVTSLVQHERIVTTLGKAKELRRKAEKMITLAKRSNLNSRRIASKSMKNKKALVKLFDTLGPRFANRHGGYTRIYRLGSRDGDAAKMAVLEWVDQEKKEDTKDKKDKKEKKETKKTKDKKAVKDKKGVKEKKEAKEKSKKAKK